MRLFGGLQSLETRAYDQFLRWRPNEAEQDERILIVKVDGPSGEWLRQEMITGTLRAWHWNHSRKCPVGSDSGTQ